MKKYLRWVSGLAALVMLISSTAAYAYSNGSLIPQQKASAVPFTDLQDSWCSSYVETVYQAGLMEGKSAQTFAPADQVTYAQITVIADRLLNLLEGKSGTPGTVQEGEAWYQPAYNDLIQQGILSPEGEYNPLNWSGDGNDFCRRSYSVKILNAVLKAANVTLPVINHVTAIPDVQADSDSNSAVYTSAVYMFYNAGILNGSDCFGGFHGSSDLTRGQAAAMLARIADPGQRLTFTLPDYDICRDVLQMEPDTAVMVIEGTTITAEQIARDVMVWMMCDWLTPQEAFAQVVANTERYLAPVRMLKERGLTVRQEWLDSAAADAKKSAGFLGITENGWLWRNTSAAAKSELSCIYVEEYGDKESAGKLDADLDAYAETFSVTLTDVMKSVNLSALRARAEAAVPVL